MRSPRSSAFICGLFIFTASAEQIAIKAGHVVDPATATVKHNQILLIDGSRLMTVSAIPAGVKVIDLSASYVLPGLIDAHTHLCATVDAKWDLGDFWIMAQQRRAGFRAIQGATHAREMLEAGFTSVRDLGNAGDYLDADLEKAIRFGITPGPGMVFAGRIIAPFGGQFWDTPADRKALDNPEYAFADSHDEMRKAIRENIYFGARVIKIVVDAQSYVYSEDDIRFVVAEAAAAKVKVAAHCQTARGAHNAIAAGVGSVEHGWKISDADLALAAKNKVALVTTDFTAHMLELSGFTPDAAQSKHAEYIERLRRAYTGGVEIVFGSDIMADSKGFTRGQLALEYVDNFPEAGIAAPVALRAFTTNAARLMDNHSETDLIAVAANPLDDISALKHISFVMKNGKVIR
jgi:imidazolonepropionase-like amidohydrolase